MKQIHLWCDFIAGDIERFTEVHPQKKLGKTNQPKMGGREEIRFWFSALNLPSTSRRTISAERPSKIFKLQVKSSCTQGTLWCCGSWIRVDCVSVSMVADGNILHVLSNWGDLGDLGFWEKFYCVKAWWWECHLSQGLLGPKKVPPPTHQPTQRPRSSSSIRGTLLARITVQSASCDEKKPLL